MAREGHFIIKDSSIAAYMRRLRGEQAEGSKKIKLRQAYQAEVRNEQNIERIKNGLGIGGRIQFRT